MSNLSHLLSAYRNHPAILKIAQSLESQGAAARIKLKGLTGAQESFVVAATANGQKPPSSEKATAGKPDNSCHLFIANSKEEAAYRQNDLEGLLADQSVYFFPDSFKRPAFFDDLNPTQMLQRSELISKITSPSLPPPLSPPHLGGLGGGHRDLPRSLVRKSSEAGSAQQVPH